MNADYSILVGKNVEFLDKLNLDDYKCTICKKVAIDCQSSNCGCIFCKHCIEEYLQNGDKPCPGKTDFCTDLNVSADISVNMTLKRRIGSLQVKCVFGCGHVTKFENLLDHIRVCEQGVTDCPYKSIGCTVTNIRKKELKSHMTNAAIEHADNFINWANMVDNKFNVLNFDCGGECDEKSKGSSQFEEFQKEIENRTNTSFSWTIYGYKAHFERGRENPEYCIDSEPIYLSGYCFLLRFNPYYFFPANECYYVALKYAVRKGKYDDKLKWPCTKKIHLGILKRCGSVYNSKCTLANELKPTLDSPLFSEDFGLAHCKFVNDPSKNLQLNGDLQFTISIE